MNIAFDATAILGPMSKNRGIGNYALSQFVNMIDMDKDNNYFLINFFENIKLSLNVLLFMYDIILFNLHFFLGISNKRPPPK